MRIFDSDQWIADAWHRLQTVDFIPAGAQLPRHETDQAW
jgi:hypothetical protein